MLLKAIIFSLIVSSLALSVLDNKEALLRPSPLPARQLDAFSTGMMKEDGVFKASAPHCKGHMGWVYRSGHCYMFTSYRLPFVKAEEECSEAGGYLADILSKEENDWIKSVLNVINPKDGTDYWIGRLDKNNLGMHWAFDQMKNINVRIVITAAHLDHSFGKESEWSLVSNELENPMSFKDPVQNQPEEEKAIAHMKFNSSWNVKTRTNGKDNNGFICKKKIE